MDFFLFLGGLGSVPVPLIVPFALSRVSVNTHFGPVSIPDRTASPSTGNLKCCSRVVERKIIKIQIYPRFAIRPIKNSLLVHHFYPRCALSCLKNRMALEFRYRRFVWALMSPHPPNNFKMTGSHGIWTWTAGIIPHKYLSCGQRANQCHGLL